MNLVRLEAQEGNDGGREGYHTKDLVWQSYDVVVAVCGKKKKILLFYEESQEIKSGTCNVLCMHLVWYIGVNLY